MHNRNKFTGIENRLMVTKREREGAYKLGPQDQQIKTTLHKTDKQKGFTV